MSLYRRKSPIIEAIRLPRDMQIVDGCNSRGRPNYLLIKAGEYLVVEDGQYYKLSAEEFAAQFEEDAHAVVRHRLPEHVQGETTHAVRHEHIWPEGTWNWLVPPLEGSSRMMPTNMKG